jgi:hypothetical protein
LTFAPSRVFAASLKDGWKKFEQFIDTGKIEPARHGT